MEAKDRVHGNPGEEYGSMIRQLGPDACVRKDGCGGPCECALFVEEDTEIGSCFLSIAMRELSDPGKRTIQIPSLPRRPALRYRHDRAR